MKAASHNPVAAALRKVGHRVVKSKKLYSRKQKHKGAAQ